MTIIGGMRACCIKCDGEVILIEDGGTMEAYGYGYGTFVCQECGARSSYYGDGLKTIAPVYRREGCILNFSFTIGFNKESP